MKTTKAKTGKEINWALPGQTVSHEDFMAAIKKAEEGPFYDLDEAMQRLEQWKKDKGL
jgi:hypothetical protein